MLADTNIKPIASLPPRLELLRASFPELPQAGPELARTILGQVAAGERAATVRISHPGRVVAFGRRDARASGHPAAVAAAERLGFRHMERITGGRVAAHAEGTLSLSLVTPEAEPASGTVARFRFAAGLVRDSLADLGVDARLGPIPGEYCPGDWSVNGAGRIKLAGIGQRMIRGAAHIGIVIVATGAADVRTVLGPVHGALGLGWDPGTVGAVEDLSPGVTRDDVEAALLSRLEAHSELRPVDLDRQTRESALAGARLRGADRVAS